MIKQNFNFKNYRGNTNRYILVNNNNNKRIRLMITHCFEKRLYFLGYLVSYSLPMYLVIKPKHIRAV